MRRNITSRVTVLRGSSRPRSTLHQHERHKRGTEYRVIRTFLNVNKTVTHIKNTAPAHQNRRSFSLSSFWKEESNPPAHSEPVGVASTPTRVFPPKLRVHYYYEGDNRPKVFKAKLEPNQTTLKVSDLMNYLVEDNVDLREIQAIRYFKERDNGFVLLPEDEIKLSKIKGDTLELQLEKKRHKDKSPFPHVTLDPNIGLIYDRLNPTIETKFWAVGKQERRKYKSEIITWGLKVDFSFRLQMTFVFNPPFRALWYSEPIELGRGFDIAIPSTFCMTLATFKNSPGGVFMLGIPVGLGAAVSMVTGGILEIADPTNKNIPPLRVKKEKPTADNASS